MMKINHTNLWLNPLLDVYPKELRMIILVLNNYVLNHALLYSFATLMQWLFIAASTAIYNKTMKIVTFQLMSNKTKKLTKKKLSQILKLPSICMFYDVTTEKSFFFEIILRCLAGRSLGLDKEKLDLYSIVVGLYYGLDIDYASFLCEEFGNLISHSKLATGVSSARFGGLIFRQVYTQEYALFPNDVDIAKFPSMTVPKLLLDDAKILLNVAQISDSMLKLVNPTHQLLVKYRASMDSTPTCILPLKVPSKGVEEEEVVKENVPTKTGKRVLKRTKNTVKKPYESETTKPIEEPIIETVEPIVEKIPMENPTYIIATIAQVGEPDLSSPGSVVSRNRTVLDVVQKLKKRKATPVEDKLEDVFCGIIT
ncbi:unnamed protein product [Lactuca saligna]|uniref:Uncharacterized protein n=1 Tax=Lactuca saligna TaxID=75948 RepID=A0AA35VHV6_LACSI|nr:unnamed protein product [Lactuca saligna]